jgi:hypothetical protein
MAEMASITGHAHAHLQALPKAGAPMSEQPSTQPVRKQTSSRKHRGAATERLIAAYWQTHGFPYAEAVRGAGRDLTGTGPIAPEIKARSGFSPLAWMKQAKRNSRPDDLPCVIFRCNGQGPESIDDWPVMLPHKTFLRLLSEAGYGTGATA